MAVFRVGYARVFTPDQDLDAQKDLLTRSGCARIFTDTATGVERTGLFEALNFMGSGDQLVISSLNRLGRSLKEITEIIQTIEERKISLHVILEDIDTRQENGPFFFYVFSILSNLEHNLIRERTRVGLDTARSQGRVGGRPRALEDEQIEIARKLIQDSQMRIDDICRMLGVSKPTLYRSLKRSN